MNRVIFVTTFIFFFALFVFPGVTPAVAAYSPVSHQLSGHPDQWNFETSGAVEQITRTDAGWVCKAGGNNASTHYARIRYKIPERDGMTWTSFYQKTTVILPPDFYDKQTNYLRIMNTDNFGTKLNGKVVGAANSDEFRTGVYLYSDHSLRLRSEHENHKNVEYYRYKGHLSAGEHTLELFGDVSRIAPWWFKIDGKVVAKGKARLSPDSVPKAERVITRMVAGIDGAAGYDNASVSLTIKDVMIANHMM